MEWFLRQLVHLLWIAVWGAAAALLWIWRPWAGVIFLGAGIVAYIWARKRGKFEYTPPPARDDGGQNSEREARMVITQVMKSLTRVQVAYLCQDFDNTDQARSWLKQALPRAFRQNIDEIYRELEQARAGSPAPGLKLPLRVLDRRDELLGMIDAMDKLKKKYPDHVVSSPVIFVITEDIADDTEAEVTIIAGWNPHKPTLLPAVDLVTLFSEPEGERHIRGQTPFESLKAALADRLERANSGPDIYAAPDVEEDPARLGVRLGRVPLGFVIGAAELI
jgi:hypothetical protein